MIEVTVKELVLAYPSLVKIGEKELPQKAAYRIARIVAKVRSEVVTYEEQRVKLVKQHGERQKDGNYMLKRDAASIEAFEQGSEDLLTEKVKIEYDPIPLSLFKRKEKDVGGNYIEVEVDLDPEALSHVLSFVDGDK